MKNSFFLGLFSFAVWAGQSVAEEEKSFQPSSEFIWSGAYLGASIGHRWGSVDWIHNENIGTDERFSVDPNGVMFGAFAGYQQQFGSLVVGGEIQMLFGEADDARSSGAGAINPGDPRLRTAVLSDVFAATARVGYAYNRFHFYGKAGVAVADIEINHRRISNNFLFPPNHWDNEVGYVIGGGIEAQLTDKVILGVDYSHFNFSPSGMNPIAGRGCNGLDCGDTINDVDMGVLVGRVIFKF